VARFEEKAITPKSAPPGRYLLRDDKPFADPYEAEILEWSSGGRVKLSHGSGHVCWEDKGGLPLLVERLPAAPKPEGASA
jgi:hypothetical protein